MLTHQVNGSSLRLKAPLVYSGAFFVFFAITHWSSLFLFEHEIPHYQSAEIVMDKSTSSRIAIISDTHGYLDERIAAVVTGCDYVLHAGDVGGAGIIKKLKPRSKAIVVQGNNDVPEKWTKEELPILETLPMEAYLDLPGGRIVVVHGHRAGSVSTRHKRLRSLYVNVRAIVYGHSHRMVCDQSEYPWVINPGAAGKARTFGGPSCIVLTATAGEWTIETIRY